ncbi:DUF2795 domain-containing protein [Paraburkholderia sp. CNPSo 3272]|uniref:DUF2795 domain-containing protein n=1 Tax=Paraburkholderia sp. CNPSo 3272 TaxID=2940931 RepID=UPI0020B6A31F|nr:DUF2795 domain-containing protein [Paraburkholderia sp. CNPSo 3272]MCP3722967.1 DUF2795 domain-containing protein [Paraburkholderia sp. CNPSo 3272]
MSQSRETEGKRPLTPFVEVQKALKGANYPADKNSLIDAARANGADDDVMKRLDALPEQEYQSPADVSKAVGNE